MGVILNSTDEKKLSEIKTANQKLVLVGGCFDILHAAHIEFLTEAKKQGDKLIILLESDERIKNLKGKNRPINTQNDRAIVLSNLSMVDYVLPLNYLETDDDYQILVKLIKPDIIAITVGNKIFDWEREYAEKTGNKIVGVMERKKDYSTTKIEEKIKL